MSKPLQCHGLLMVYQTAHGNDLADLNAKDLTALGDLMQAER
jgi:hypothetical protein